MKLILPLRVKIGANKTFIANLNNYRNAFYFDLNKAKIAYTAAVVDQLPAGNRLLAKIHRNQAELIRQLKALKKKHKNEPGMYEMLEPKILAEAKATREFLLDGFDRLKTLRVDKQVFLNFKYFHGNRAKIDTSNPCSVIDKFTCDALTAAGIWPDDDSSVVRKTSYEWGGVDKVNPRCELTILVAPVQDVGNNELF